MSKDSSIFSWRQSAFKYILRAQLVAWLLAYLAGVGNAIYNYWNHEQHLPAALQFFLLSITIYSLAFFSVWLVFVANRLSYSRQLFLVLTIYYLLSLGLFGLSGLSGDARLFLFVFVIMAALFLDPPYPYVAIALGLLAFLVMGSLHLTGIIQPSLPNLYNTMDLPSWITGSIVFAGVSITATLGIQRLLQSFSSVLEQEQRTTTWLRLLSDVNQWMTREQSPPSLLQKTAQRIFQNGYAGVWLGMLTMDESKWQYTFGFGSLASSTCCDDPWQSIQRRRKLSAPPRFTFPLLRPEQSLGALVLETSALAPVEETIFQELADNLAYVLETLRANDQRQALTETARNLLSARSEAELWNTALAAAQNILRSGRAAVYHYDPATDRLSCPYSKGLSPKYIQTINQMFRELPGARLLQNPTPLLINDIQSHVVPPKIRDLLQAEGIQAYAVFPMFSTNKLYGAFVAYRSEPRPFTPADIDAGQTLANLLAALLQNAQLFEEILKKSSQQAAFFIAAQEMSAQFTNLPNLLQVLAQQLASLLDASSAYLISLNETNRTLQVVAEHWSEEANEKERKSDLNRVYPLDDFPFIAATMKKGLPLVLQADDPQLAPAERDEFFEYNIQTKLFIPLLLHGELVGYAEIWESRYRREFTQSEIFLAQTLASFAASILYTSNLFAELEQREAYFRALTENAAEGIAVLDKEGNVKYLSPIEQKILGYDTHASLNHSIRQKIHPDDLRFVLKSFLKSLRQPNVPVTTISRVQNKKGEWRVLEATLTNLLRNPVVNGIVVNFRDITRRKRVEEQLQQSYDETLAGWARALELRDKDTEGHTRRVTDLTIKLARVLNLDEEQITHIRRGALLHDIGKVAIPDAILHKTDTLTAQEWETMRQHPQYAYDMLKDIAYLRPALEIPYCHHEKWDGTGYPRGLKGEEIPLAARIFAIADVWDALTSDRPYRPGWNKQRALRYISEQAGKQFDPRLVEIFLQLMTQSE